MSCVCLKSAEIWGKLVIGTDFTLTTANCVMKNLLMMMMLPPPTMLMPLMVNYTVLNRKPLASASAAQQVVQQSQSKLVRGDI